jgi:probable HAF family extracellular repeat protein
MHRFYSLAALILCVVLFAIPTLMAQRYTVTDLGTLGGSQTIASAINQAGDVTGSANLTCDACYSHAFLYKKGKLHDLGTLPRATVSAGLGISGGEDEGKIRVTGYSYTQPCVHSDCGPVHAFLYSNGHMLDLGTLPSGTQSEGFAVNSSGQVTGWADVEDAQNTSFQQHAFLYSDGKMKDLGTLPGGSSSFGVGINDGWGRGRNNGVQVTGYSSTTSGFEHAFLYSDGKMEDLGTLPGGSSSIGSAVNQSGEVAGFSAISVENSHAFLYRHGDLQDLGTLPGLTDSFGEGINDDGDVVGYSVGSANIFDYHAFLYSHGTMHDLESMIPEDSGWVLQIARAINNDGQIAGTGIHNGTTRAFLLTPIRNRGWMGTR